MCLVIYLIVVVELWIVVSVDSLVDLLIFDCQVIVGLSDWVVVVCIIIGFCFIEVVVVFINRS